MDEFIFCQIRNIDWERCRHKNACRVKAWRSSRPDVQALFFMKAPSSFDARLSEIISVFCFSTTDEPLITYHSRHAPSVHAMEHGLQLVQRLHKIKNSLIYIICWFCVRFYVCENFLTLILTDASHWWQSRWYHAWMCWR